MFADSAPGNRWVVRGSEAGGLRRRQRRGSAGGRDGLGRLRRRAGRQVLVSPNPVGDQSPWKERVLARRQRCAGATDPAVEQRLVVEGRRSPADSSARLRRSNGAEATQRGDASAAAAGGTSSRGVKGVAGIPRACRTSAVVFGRRSTERSSTRANAANPFRHRDATSPDPWPVFRLAVEPSGSALAEQTVEVVQNHEGGTRPVGWHRRAEGGGDVAGSGRRQACRGRGTRFERIPREAGGDAAGNRGGAASGLTGAPDGPRTRGTASRAREDPEDPAGNGGRSRGEQQRPTSCYRERVWRPAILETLRHGPTVPWSPG
jgi:hypothetical protein